MKRMRPTRRTTQKRAEADLAALLAVHPGRTGKVRTCRVWAGCVLQYRYLASLDPKATA
jgi:fido (protein-threonine AMPylation protein)